MTRKAELVSLADVVEGADVRVIERGDRPGLASEPGAELRIVGERARQHLDRDGPIQPRVGGPIDLAHPTGADGGADLIRAQAGTRGKRHVAGIIERRIARGKPPCGPTRTSHSLWSRVVVQARAARGHTCRNAPLALLARGSTRREFPTERARLRQFGPPVADTVAPSHYARIQNLTDGGPRRASVITGRAGSSARSVTTRSRGSSISSRPMFPRRSQRWRSNIWVGRSAGLASATPPSAIGAPAQLPRSEGMA